MVTTGYSIPFLVGAQFCHFVPVILIQFPDSHIRDKMDCRWNQGRSHTFRIDEARSVITKGAILGGKGLGGGRLATCLQKILKSRSSETRLLY